MGMEVLLRLVKWMLLRSSNRRSYSLVSPKEFQTIVATLRVTIEAQIRIQILAKINEPFDGTVVTGPFDALDIRRVLLGGFEFGIPSLR
jgi:hypothetical protein